MDEVQLWKKLEELDRLYEAALIEERARCDALLEEQKAASGAVISKYKRELEKLSQPEQDSGQAEPGDLPDREERGVMRADNVLSISQIIRRRRNEAEIRNGYLSLLGRILILALIGWALFTQVF